MWYACDLRLQLEHLSRRSNDSNFEASNSIEPNQTQITVLHPYY